MPKPVYRVPEPDFECEGATLYYGDCLKILPRLQDQPTACVCDPPYGLKFMGKEWDHGLPSMTFWKAVFRVLKPGAPLLAFGGTRTFHRLFCAIEDAGFELRDTLMWVHGQGFPKSRDVSKDIDKAAGAEREVVGQTMYGDGKTRPAQWSASGSNQGWKRPAHENYKGNRIDTTPATEAAKLWDGYGTALKPAHEPICLAMKPNSGTFAQNALEHGVAGLNVDGCRVGTEAICQHGRSASQSQSMSGPSRAQQKGSPYIGRWPANLIHDGSEEVVELFPETSTHAGTAANNHKAGMFGVESKQGKVLSEGDSGSAARFFYCAKASRKDRTCDGAVNNTHPTVKPRSLMEWLCKLVTPPENGLILDPFMGSGSTAIGAILAGSWFVGIEKDEDSFNTAIERIKAALAEGV